MKSLSFDNLFEYYDETRIIPENIFSEMISYITKKFPVSIYPKIFEPGVGNGRIAIPLAKKGYEITGIDISPLMLNDLQKKIKKEDSKIVIKAYKGDITDLKFTEKSFNLSLVVHLFYFIEEWKKALEELVRVTESYILLINTGYGMEIPELNDKYKNYAKDYGFIISPVGVRRTEEVLEDIKESGYSYETIDDKWVWVSKNSVGQALFYLRNRAYSFTTFASDEIHKKIIVQLEREYEEEKIIEVENRIKMNIISL
jgi:ubiquinone/menaquinone biosynthesis C-methylase UbiE